MTRHLRHSYRLLGPLSLLVALTACGDDDPMLIAYSETISIRLGGIKEDEVRDGQAAEDKSVKEESGNPYKDFLDTARDRLGGTDPSAIRVRSAILRIHADTRGVNGFEEVFESIEVFLANESTTIPIGQVDAPRGTSQRVSVTASALDLEPLQASLLSDNTKVGVRGPVVDAPPADFDLRITVDLVFEALR